jgi:integrase/recombinase XerD
MPVRKLPKTLTREEIDALMAAPSLQYPTGLRNRCILELMHRSGLRVSEACGIHLRDINWRELEIHLRPEVAKGGREAPAYLDPRSVELLERWKTVRRQYAAGKPHFFTTLQGGPVTRQYVYAMVQRMRKRAGIKKPVSPHVLRHTYATELLREGFNIVEVQKLMRHADIRSTVIYTEIVDRELKEKIRRRG